MPFIFAVTFTTNICSYFLPLFSKAGKGNTQWKLVLNVNDRVSPHVANRSLASGFLVSNGSSTTALEHTDQNYHSDSERIIHQKCDALSFSDLI